MKFLIFFILPGLAYGQSINCTKFPDHTMCKYQAKACTNKTLYASSVSSTDVPNILKSHNDLRNKVATGQQTGQPSATNIKQLQYCDDLATIAQRWADQCTFAHDTNRNVAAYYVGQNVAVVISSAKNCAPNFNQAINLWYNEVTNPGFDKTHIKPFQFDGGSGHYTQVVWAETKCVGCGFTCYKEGSLYKTLYVCNYGPGGNVLGTSMYEAGTPASACPAGKSTTYSGLCL